MKHLEGSLGSGFRPNGTVRKDVGQRYEEEPSYVLDCKLQIGAVSSLSFIFYIFRTSVTGPMLAFCFCFREIYNIYYETYCKLLIGGI